MQVAVVLSACGRPAEMRWMWCFLETFGLTSASATLPTRSAAAHTNHETTAILFLHKLREKLCSVQWELVYKRRYGGWGLGTNDLRVPQS